jgi:hypothetical protein
MKKVLLTLLGVILVAGILAGAGYAGYRIGYDRGVTASANGTATFIPWLMPMHNFNQGFNPQGMPMHNFGRGNERGFERGFGPGGFGMHGGGFGFFPLLHLLFWGVVIWLAYKWIKNSGWTLTRQAVQNTSKSTVDIEQKND